MAIATIAQSILRGDISTYLAANDSASGAIWGARKAPTSAVTIAIVTDALRWSVNSQTVQQKRNMANYLIWLTGMYGQQAQAISGGSGGGSVIPGGGSTAPLPLQFVVSASSVIPTGGTTLTINTFAGYNLIFVRGSFVQATPDIGGTTYTWDKDTGYFTCNEALVDELFQLFPI